MADEYEARTGPGRFGSPTLKKTKDNTPMGWGNLVWDIKPVATFEELNQELYQDFFAMNASNYGMSPYQLKRELSHGVVRYSGTNLNQEAIDKYKALSEQFAEYQKGVDPEAKRRKYLEKIAEAPGREATLLTGRKLGEINTLLGIPGKPGGE